MAGTVDLQFVDTSVSSEIELAATNSTTRYAELVDQTAPVRARGGCTFGWGGHGAALLLHTWFSPNLLPECCQYAELQSETTDADVPFQTSRALM